MCERTLRNAAAVSVLIALMSAAGLCNEIWNSGYRPPPLLTVSQWADRHRQLSQVVASEPGRWRTERTPYLRDVMDALSPSSPWETVVLIKAAQLGGTEAGNNWIGYAIVHPPGPMLFVS